jgi:hypothetical protein
MGDFDTLMDDVCVKWGFCGCMKHDQPLHVSDIIPSYGPVTADQFVEWVFLADNLNPNDPAGNWRKQKLAIREAFVLHMGSEIADAADLRWQCIKELDEPEPADAKYRGRID